MFSTKLKTAAVWLLVVGSCSAGAGLLAGPTPLVEQGRKDGKPQASAKDKERSANAAAPNAEVQKVLERFRSAHPSDKDLAVFQLDWVPALKTAREKAAKEQRPILLLVVTNSYGNLYTGHC
jgi:hypothetical protein